MSEAVELAESALRAFDEYWGDGGPVDPAYGRQFELIRALLAEVRAGVVAEEPEWESDTIQYGHVLGIDASGTFIVEPRGKNYSTYQRRVKLGKPESSWVPVEQGDGDD